MQLNTLCVKEQKTKATLAHYVRLNQSQVEKTLECGRSSFRILVEVIGRHMLTWDEVNLMRGIWDLMHLCQEIKLMEIANKGECRIFRQSRLSNEHILTNKVENTCF